MCECWFLLFHWLTAADINFKVFMEAIIHESIIFWWLQRPSPWKLNADLFCLFDKLSDQYVYRLIDNLFLWNQPSMNLKSCWWLTSSSSDMNFKAFEEAAIIHRAYNLFIPLAWWCYQNKETFVYLNVDCLCLFDKLSMTGISKFSGK